MLTPSNTGRLDQTSKVIAYIQKHGFDSAAHPLIAMNKSQGDVPWRHDRVARRQQVLG